METLLDYQKELSRRYESSVTDSHMQFMGISFPIKYEGLLDAYFLFDNTVLKDIDDGDKYVDVPFLNKWLIGFNYHKGKFNSVIDFEWLINFLINYKEKGNKNDMKNSGNDYLEKLLYINNEENIAFLIKSDVQLVFQNEVELVLKHENKDWKEYSADLSDVTFNSNDYAIKLLERAVKNKDLTDEEILQNRGPNILLELIKAVYVYKKNKIIFSFDIEKILRLMVKISNL